MGGRGPELGAWGLTGYFCRAFTDIWHMSAEHVPACHRSPIVVALSPAPLPRRDAAMNGMRRRIAGKTPSEIREMSKDAMKEPVTQDDFLQVGGRAGLVRRRRPRVRFVRAAHWAAAQADTPPPKRAAFDTLRLSANMPSPRFRAQAIAKINPSVGEKDILRHENWLKEYGSV